MRLIDADKLIDDMKNELEKAVNDENLDKADCMVIMTSAIALKDFINRQPVAFDVDRVVEQFESLKKIAEIMRKIDIEHNAYIEEAYERGRIYVLNEAIEIVKDGGIDE